MEMRNKPQNQLRLSRDCSSAAEYPTAKFYKFPEEPVVIGRITLIPVGIGISSERTRLMWKKSVFAQRAVVERDL